ncbi:hypothetical protein PU560_00355, partial [Georgenia sp. 10Sc9-8]|nr:hypothetical protein [Georgenia halotolerans]
DETSPEDDGTDPADEETDAAPSEPEDDPTDNLPDFGTELATSGAFPGAGGDLLHSTVRIGLHEDFDRVVFDFIGTGIPQYEVQYVEEPTQQGSGRPV